MEGGTLNTYMVGGRMNAATTAATDDIAAHLWNPSTTKTIFVREVWFTKSAATADGQKLIRTTTIGTTPGATITPDIDNDVMLGLAPVSVAVMYTANFATEPVVAGPALAQTNLPAAVGAGFIWVFSTAIAVPAGTGLAVASPTAVIIQIADITYVWDE